MIAISLSYALILQSLWFSSIYGQQQEINEHISLYGEITIKL